jgi:hypothetical protein
MKILHSSSNDEFDNGGNSNENYYTNSSNEDINIPPDIVDNLNLINSSIFRHETFRIAHLESKDQQLMVKMFLF